MGVRLDGSSASRPSQSSTRTSFAAKAVLPHLLSFPLRPSPFFSCLSPNFCFVSSRLKHRGRIDRPPVLETSRLPLPTHLIILAGRAGRLLPLRCALTFACGQDPSVSSILLFSPPSWICWTRSSGRAEGSSLHASDGTANRSVGGLGFPTLGEQLGWIAAF